MILKKDIVVMGFGILGMTFLDVTQPQVITAALLAAIAGPVLSWCLDNMPKFSVWFQALNAIPKKWFLRLFLFLTAIAVLALSCWGFASAIIAKYFVLQCTKAGLVELVEVFFTVLVTNQGWFLISKKTRKTGELEYTDLAEQPGKYEV